MAPVAGEHGKTLAQLHNELALWDSGLDSLGVAVLIARLEGELGVDPFAASEDGRFPVTFGDLVKFYADRAY